MTHNGRATTRQINHYYPYGFRMRMGYGRKYNNMYTGKELQTGEYWDASVSPGLEMYDFEARFFDPQLGRSGRSCFYYSYLVKSKEFLKGKGFKTNSNVFKDFAAGKYTSTGGVWQQDALDYFGINAKYSPNSMYFDERYGTDPTAWAAVNAESGEIHFNDMCVVDSYDNMMAVSKKEVFTSMRVQNGTYTDLSSEGMLLEEFRGFKTVDKNQGFYPNYSTPLMDYLDSYGKAIGLPKMSNFSFDTGIHEFYFKRRWIDFIYRIPRRF